MASCNLLKLFSYIYEEIPFNFLRDISVIFFYVPLNKVLSNIGQIHWILVLIAPCTKASLAPVLTHPAGLEVSSFVRASLYFHTSGGILVTSLLNKVFSNIGQIHWILVLIAPCTKASLAPMLTHPSGLEVSSFVRASLYFHTSRGILATSLLNNVLSIVGPVHWILVLIAPCTKASLAPMLTHPSGLEVSSFVRASLYFHTYRGILVTSLLKYFPLLGQSTDILYSSHRVQKPPWRI